MSTDPDRSRLSTRFGQAWNRLGPWNPILLAFLVLLAIAFVVTALGWNGVPWFLGQSDKKDTLSFIGVAMGGTLLALNAAASHRRAKAMEDAAAAQANAMHAQADANKQTEHGRRQERFKSAIEHLGHESAAVRLGGRYELYNLAKETPELRQTVLSIFCSYIRQTTSESDYRRLYDFKPSLEVQDLLTLVFVRQPDVFQGCRIDLEESWLNGADLRRARLWNANLRGVRLFKGQLDNARLQRATLCEADLRGASLSHASLQESNLFGVHMEASYLLHAELQGATVAAGKLTGAYLAGARMQGVDLSSASMYGVNLTNAELQGAACAFSYAQGAVFKDADMRGMTATELHPSIGFADRITGLIGVDGDYSGIAYFGITGNAARKLVESVNAVDKQKAEILEAQLSPHIDHDYRRGLPDDAEIVTGAFGKDEAKRWIARHEQAMSQVPPVI